MGNLPLTLQSRESVAPDADRRTEPRYLQNRICYVRPNGQGAGVAWGVRLRDISRGGLRIVMRLRIRPGTILAIQPTRQSQQPPLVARVVWCHKYEDGWHYGCTLLRPLPEQELRRWLDS